MAGRAGFEPATHGVTCEINAVENPKLLEAGVFQIGQLRVQSENSHKRENRHTKIRDVFALLRFVVINPLLVLNLFNPNSDRLIFSNTIILGITTFILDEIPK